MPSLASRCHTQHATMILLTPKLDSPPPSSRLSRLSAAWIQAAKSPSGLILATAPTPAEIDIFAFGSEGWGFESLRARQIFPDDLVPSKRFRVSRQKAACFFARLSARRKQNVCKLAVNSGSGIHTTELR
jgi:hypothetical protein